MEKEIKHLCWSSCEHSSYCKFCMEEVSESDGVSYTIRGGIFECTIYEEAKK